MSATRSRVAIVGCGVISPVYATTLGRLDHVEVAACVDDVPGKADELAQSCGAKVMTFDEVLADPSIDAVVNLTPPLAHSAVTGAVLDAGKAAFSEKPLGVDFAEGRALVDSARERGLRLGCAPDTFLGVGLQTCRAIIDRGDIGEPLAANAFMQQPGPEWWHPSPGFFYAHGSGPLLDMGPYYLTALVQLLGPAASVVGTARISRPQRTIRSKPRRGESIDVEVPTHVSAAVEFASGPIATMVTSFDVAASRYRHIEIYGTEATLAVPDPNTFRGPVLVRGVRDEWWRDVELNPKTLPQQRGIGLGDMMWAQRTGRPHRASAELALHVLEIMDGTLASARDGRRVALTTTCDRAAPLPTDLERGQFDD
jgi:predicted dehydrogenase